MPMIASNPKRYKGVKLKEAVYTDEYDVMFDVDFIIQFAVDVVLPTLGKKRMTTNSCDSVFLMISKFSSLYFY